MRILISGASGFIGSALTIKLKENGHQVIPLVRRKAGAGEISWDPDKDLIDLNSEDRIDGVINLAAENIGIRRWSKEQKNRIYQSRVRGTRLLAHVVDGLPAKPAFFLNASAVGIYGNQSRIPIDESAPNGDGFLADVCVNWEKQTENMVSDNIRICLLRFGVVIGPGGGIVKKLLTPFRLGLGAIPGDGNNYLSWISLEDTVNAVLHVTENKQISGPVNIVSNGPLPCKEFYRAFGKELHRPVFLHVPGILIRLILGEMGDEMILKGQNVMPGKLLESGFNFKHPDITSALRYALNSHAKTRK